MWVDALQQAIADRLAAQLPAKLQEIEDDYGDQIALELPAEIHPCDKAVINSTPAVEVWCPDSGRRNSDESAGDYEHRITVVWTIAGTDEAEIDKRIKRYIYATIQLLDGATFGPDEDVVPMIAGACTYLVVDQEAADQPFTRTAAVEFTSGSFAKVEG